MAKHKTIRIDAKRYEDSEDCLADAASDVAEELELSGYEMSPRWENDERDVILVDVPADFEVESDQV